MKVPGQDVQDKDINSNFTSSVGLITERSEKIVQKLRKSKRLKDYFWTVAVINFSQKVLTETEIKV